MKEAYKLLRQLYATHAPTGREWSLICLIRDYLAVHVQEATVRMDGWGNLYVTKGKPDGGYSIRKSTANSGVANRQAHSL